MTDDELLAAFEDRSLPFKRWNHRAHVRIAFLYASRYRLQEATDRMRTGIRSYNAVHDVPEALDQGYHETITRAFMRLVHAAQRLTGPHRSSDDFCDLHPELLDRFALRRFYSKQRIMTMEAKLEFVEPDLGPLPLVVDDSLTIMDATGGGQLQTARELFTEFAGSLEFDLGFQNFPAELAGLPGAYVPPAGRLLIAFHGSSPAGCVALRPLGDGVCEMKRLWVRPAFRGTGLGRILAEEIISEARRIDYAAMRLDTVPSMKAAIRLYRSLGFVEIAPYTGNPIPGALFMELRINDSDRDPADGSSSEHR